MKTIINKLRYTLLLGFIALAVFGNNLNAAAPSPVTVCDGQTTNNHIPLYGLYYDEYVQMSQMIYPYSLLANLVDKPINSLTFYSSSNITDLKDGIFNIKIGTTSTTQFGSSPTRITGLTTVVTTNMTACQSGRNLVINFDQTFTYTQSDYNSGKNLVIEFESTSTGEYQSLSFYGVNNYSNSSYYNGNNTTTRYSFLPKLTFGFADLAPVINAPSQVNYDVAVGESLTQTINVSGENLTGNITATISDANGVFSFSPNSLVTTTTLNSSGGTLNITYSPSAVGTHNATITLSGGGATSVTINLNGTCANFTNFIFCDGGNSDEHLPVYGYYYEQDQVNQMLYPSTMFAGKGMIGKKFTKLTFYPTSGVYSGTTYTGINFYKNNNGNGTVTVKVANMPSGTTGYTETSPTHKDANFVTVEKITMPTSAQTGLTEWIFEFGEEFIYEGGDLLIEVTTEKGQWAHTFFAGEEQSNYTGYFSYNNNSSSRGVKSLPKVKFDWEESTPVTNGTVSPDNVAFGAKNVGGTYTATVTVTNTGNQPFTPVIDVTGLPAGISVSPTTSGQLAAHGTLDLTVTFTPTAETSYSGSFTVTIPVPDGEDLEFTVTVTGSGYYANKLKSNTVEVPVYKSEAKADGTFIFSQDNVDIDDVNMSLSYGDCDVNVEVLVKDEEPITSYDLRHKVGSGNWASVATATQDASNPKSYVYNNDTFVIPSDATQMWLSMTDAGADASSTIYYVPVTVANGVVTQGNTYGAPQVQATTVNLEPTLSIGGSKSAGRPGGHWTQSINGTDVDYCVYTPVISISPVYPEGAVPYLVRAWLLENKEIPFFTVTRVANANDNNTHIEGGAELTYPHPLGEMELSSEMIGGPLTIGYDWTEDNAGSAGTTIQPNAFAAPSEMSQGEISIAVRVYYYKADATQSGQKALRDGSEAPADGYGYGEGNGSDEGIPTAVSSIYTDRQVVDVKYVNTIGMQSDKPFDGVNIVVTRYSDGSITTTKVLK